MRRRIVGHALVDLTYECSRFTASADTIPDVADGRGHAREPRMAIAVNRDTGARQLRDQSLPDCHTTITRSGLSARMRSRFGSSSAPTRSQVLHFWRVLVEAADSHDLLARADREEHLGHRRDQRDDP